MAMIERTDTFVYEKEVLPRVDYGSEGGIGEVFKRTAEVLKKEGACRVSVSYERLNSLLMKSFDQLNQERRNIDSRLNLKDDQVFVDVTVVLTESGWECEFCTLEIVNDPNRKGWLRAENIKSSIKDGQTKHVKELFEGRRVNGLVKGYIRKSLEEGGLNNIGSIGLQIVQGELVNSELEIDIKTDEWKSQQKTQPQPQKLLEEAVSRPGREAQKVWEERLSELRRLMDRYPGNEQLSSEYNRVCNLGSEGYWDESENSENRKKSEEREGWEFTPRFEAGKTVISEGEDIGARNGLPILEGEFHEIKNGEKAVKTDKVGSESVTTRSPEGAVKEKAETVMEATPLQLKMEDLERKRENVIDAQLNLEEAARAVREKGSLIKRRTVYGPSAERRMERYESSMNTALDEYEETLLEMNKFVAEQAQELPLSSGHDLVKKFHSLGEEAMNLYEEKFKDDVPQQKRASLLREYDEIVDKRFGILTELAERSGKSLVPEEFMDEKVIGFRGRKETAVKIKKIKPVLNTDGRKDGELVELAFRGQFGTQEGNYIRKEVDSVPDTLKIWQDLRTIGVATNREMFSDEEGKAIFIEDASARYGKDVVNPSILSLRLKNREKVPHAIPFWARNPRVVRGLVENAQRSASAGLRVEADAYRITRDPQKKKGKTGAYVDSTSSGITRSGLLESELQNANIYRVREMVFRLHLMSRGEWNKRYPDYAMRKKAA